MNSIGHLIQSLLSNTYKSRCASCSKFSLNNDGSCQTFLRLAGYIKHDFTSMRLPQQYSLV